MNSATPPPAPAYPGAERYPVPEELEHLRNCPRHILTCGRCLSANNGLPRGSVPEC